MKTNIVLIGIMGCGKTTIGKKLSELLNMAFIDIDEDIEKNYGSIPSLFLLGEHHFRDIESRHVKFISEMRNTVISTGGGVVLRQPNMKALKETGIVFYVSRSLESIINTIDCSNRPLLKNGTDILHQMHKDREHLYIENSDYIIENTDLEQSVSSIASIWNNMRL